MTHAAAFPFPRRRWKLQPHFHNQKSPSSLLVPSGQIKERLLGPCGPDPTRTFWPHTENPPPTHMPISKSNTHELVNPWRDDEKNIYIFVITTLTIYTIIFYKYSCLPIYQFQKYFINFIVPNLMHVTIRFNK